MDDRISQLPEPILHHILSLLSQEDAVRTCILSKSWRYLGPTRPKIEFRESYFGRNKKKSLSVLDNTLQRYDNQKLSIQEFILRMSRSDPGSTSLLNKWIPKVIMHMGVKTFHLTADGFSLPSVVFQAEFLEELYLEDCRLDQIISKSIGKVQMLERLSLHHVYIVDETFEKIISSCPLIQHLVLNSCRGLSTVKVNKARNLKHFDCYGFIAIDSIEMDDAPSLETIRIKNCCQNWHHLHNNNYSFPRLKSLYLWDVHLPTELLNNLSLNNCPCLEQLELRLCSGFSEFMLSNSSIKCLIIDISDRPIKAAAIDAANMLYFELRSRRYIPTISFTTTLREWKSRVDVWCDLDSNTPLKLYEFLKALSQSQISLDISFLPLTNQDTYDGGSCEPLVVVEHLCLWGYYLSSSSLPASLSCLFRICRPRYIGLPLYAYSRKVHKSRLADIWKTLVNILIKKGETRQCDFWQQDLEESSIQVLQENAHEWRTCQVCEFSNNEEIRFRFKWRDLS